MTQLSFHNSLTRRREPFRPIDPLRVRMYVCGPTVYDLAHLGNARPVVVFDVLARLLERVFGNVTYVRNITDVDDKINARARESGESIAAVTARTAADFQADMAALNNRIPTREPRATDHIPQMIALCEKLIASGHAYAAEGHVLFAVASFADYGRLSGRHQDELLAGARIDVAPYKRDPGDFVLWKPSDETLPGWDSPWGRGRPGWHIECSAMAWEHLGETFDIHGGGADLLFPHHENEVAQSRCAHGTGTMANFWLHNGMLTVDGEKMSKSLGNFFVLRDVLARGAWVGEAFRLLLLRTHYRSALDYTEAALQECEAELRGFYTMMMACTVPQAEAMPAMVEWVLEPLGDDLNTPLALSRLRDLRTLENIVSIGGSASAVHTRMPAQWNPAPGVARASVLVAAEVLGLLWRDPIEVLQGGRSTHDINRGPAPVITGSGGATGLPNVGTGSATVTYTREQIDVLIAARTAARSAKNWAEADRIRADLATYGITLEDGPTGTTWGRG